MVIKTQANKILQDLYVGAKTKGTLKENANPRKDPTFRLSRLLLPLLQKGPIPANLYRCGKCACIDCPGYLQDLYVEMSLPVQLLPYVTQHETD